MTTILLRVSSSFLSMILFLLIFVLSSCAGSGTSSDTLAPANATAPVISAFTATPSVIAPGQISQLVWTVTNAGSLALNGIATTGSGTSVNPATTTTYTLVSTNSTGSAAASVTVTVGNPTVAYGNMKAADLGAGANLNGAIPFPTNNAWNADILSPCRHQFQEH